MQTQSFCPQHQLAAILGLSVVLTALFGGPQAASGQSRKSTLASSGETSLTLIAPGESLFFTPADGPFSVQRDAQNVVSVSFKHSESFGDTWLLGFAAPEHMTLSTGFFPGAGDLIPIGGITYAPNYPVISLYWPHHVCFGWNAYGIFQVKQVDYGDQGDVTSLWSVFEWNCAHDEIVRGEIRYNANVQLAVSAPLTYSGPPESTLRVDVRATDRNAGRVTLTASGVPPGASFVDHGDNTGTLSWIPGLADIGIRDVAFSGENEAGDHDRAETHLRVTGETSLFISGDPSDGITWGHDYSFDPGHDSFEVHKNHREGVSLGLLSADHSVWGLGFGAPDGAKLMDGVYEPVGSLYFQDSLPGLAVHRGFQCFDVSGHFDVRQVMFGPGLEIVSFWATFEQHCDGGMPGTRGEFRYQVSPSSLLKPARAFVVGGNRVARLRSGKPSICVQLEPAMGAFTNTDVVLSSIELTSIGTGSVPRIPSMPDHSRLDGDSDRNGVAEIQACFSKEDLRLLLSNVSDRATVPVTLEGDLSAGARFEARLDLVVQAGSGQFMVGIVHAGANAEPILTFVTEMPGLVRVKVFDVSGRLVKVVRDEARAPAGTFEIHLGREQLGAHAASGIYFVRVETPEGIASRRMLLLR